MSPQLAEAIHDAIETPSHETLRRVGEAWLLSHAEHLIEQERRRREHAESELAQPAAGGS